MEGKTSDRTPADRAREKLTAELKERSETHDKHQAIANKVKEHVEATGSALRAVDVVNEIIESMTPYQRKAARLLLDFYGEQD